MSFLRGSVLPAKLIAKLAPGRELNPQLVMINDRPQRTAPPITQRQQTRHKLGGHTE